MSFMLAPGVSFCEADGHRIFLDVIGDRYFGLSEEAYTAFTRLVSGASFRGDDRKRLVRLEQAGLLRLTSNGELPAPCPAYGASSSVLDRPKLPSPRCGLSIRAAFALRRAKREVGRTSLSRVCESFIDAKLKSQPCDPLPVDSRPPVEGQRVSRGDLNHAEWRSLKDLLADQARIRRRPLKAKANPTSQHLGSYSSTPAG